MSNSVPVHLSWLRGHVERDVLPRLGKADKATRSIWARRLRGAADGRVTLTLADFRAMYHELFAAVDLVCPLKGHHIVHHPRPCGGLHPSHYPGWAFDFDLVDPNAAAHAAYAARREQEVLHEEDDS